MSKRDKFIQRLLEILPGFVSWNLILFPYWGIIVIPNVVAYTILIFNLYWFYQSAMLSVTAIVSHYRMQASMKYDWKADLTSFPDWQKVRHFILIVNYKEPLHILERILESIANQTLPQKLIVPVIAMEAREPEEMRDEKVKALKKKFAKRLPNLTFTFHSLVSGEVVGKASNEKYAAMEMKRLMIDKGLVDLEYATVTSSDADHVYHPNHFACLTYKFLDNPKRYKYFWQPVVMFYNNIWKIPAITRVPNTLMSIWNLSQLTRKDRLINGQNYSLSFKLLHETGYWDADKIPEDWGIFFKALYETGGGIEVDGIYLPVFADAAESTSLFKTLKNQYQQVTRWAYGASDVPWWIKYYFLKKDVPFWDKTSRLIYALWAHFTWPVNWFLITVGLTLPTLLNPAFGRTALGYMVPKISSFVLTIALAFLLITIVIDNVYKPPKPATFAWWRRILVPFEFILMPIAGFFFSALPGLDAHTRLMLGKYMEYKVTEKV